MADIGTGNFTITNIVGGPYAGNTYTGTFTFDATAATTGSTDLLSFATTLPSWVGATLSNTAFATFSYAGGLELFYAPAPVGNPNAFALGCCVGFAYGETIVVNSEFSDYGSGDFSETVSSPVPEPSTLLTLGSGLIGLAGLARKRLFS
jgi:hypothetical protein